MVDKDSLVELTKRIVSVPTVNLPGENYIEMVELLERECRKLGLKTRVVKVPKDFVKKQGLDPAYPRVNLIADWDAGRKKTLHICNHFDVVPVSSDWNTDPFTPIVRKNKMFGRGTYDQKGNIAVTLKVIEELNAKGIVPKVNLQLSFVCDEEIGGACGTGYLFSKGLIKADYALGEGSEENRLTLGSRGILWTEITVLGKSAHGALPWRGVNAFDNAVIVVEELRKLARKVSKRKTSFETRMKESKTATFVMGGYLDGGKKTNMVPDRVTFTVDRRINPEETIEDAKKEIDDALERCRQKGIRIKRIFTQQHPPAYVDRTDGFVKQATAVVKKHFGPVRHLISAGAGDQRYFIYKGIPAVGYGVLGGNMHGDDEFLYVDSLPKTAEVYRDIILNIH